MADWMLLHIINTRYKLVAKPIAYKNPIITQCMSLATLLVDFDILKVAA